MLLKSIYIHKEYIYIHKEYIYIHKEYIYVHIEYIYVHIEYIYVNIEYIYVNIEYIYILIEYKYACIGVNIMLCKIMVFYVLSLGMRCAFSLEKRLHFQKPDYPLKIRIFYYPI